MKKTLIIIFKILIVVVFIILCVFLPEFVYTRTIYPPESFQFAKKGEVTILRKEQKEYYVVRNTSAVNHWLFSLSLKSSAPIYIYEKETGKLIDWSSDPEDMSSFMKKWQIK